MSSQTYRIGPAFGFAVTPRLRLGFGVYFTYATAQDSSKFTLDATDLDGTQMPSRLYLTTEAQRSNTWIGGQLIAGVQYNPFGGLHLGLTVRTPVIGFWSRGTITRSDTVVSSGTAFPGAPDNTLSEAPATSAQRAMLDPVELTVAIAYRAGRFALGLEGDLRAPLTVTRFEIDDKIQWNFRVGGQVELPKHIFVGLGVFTDRSPKQRGFFIGDYRADYYGFSAALAFDSRYEIRPAPQPRTLVFTTVVSFRYGYGIANLTGVQSAPQAPTTAELTSAMPTTQHPIFHSLALQISSAVSF